MNEKIENSLGNVIKNYFYIVVGIIYFIFYNSQKYNDISIYFSNIKYGNIFLNVFNGIIASVTIAGIIGLFILFLSRIIKKIFEKTKTKVDEMMLDEFLRYLENTKNVLSIYIFTIFLQLPDNISKIIQHFFLIVFIFLGVLFLSKLISIIFDNIIIKKFLSKSINKSLIGFLKKLSIISLWIVGIITILSNLGFNVTALVAGAGVGGLAVAFAAQKSIANIFGAVTILLNKPFKIGDFVSVNSIVGTVKDLGLSYITIIDKDGHQVMIPNEAIISSNIENFSVRESRRTLFSVGLIYGTSLEQMKKGVKIVEGILEVYVTAETIKHYRVNFDMFGDFSLHIKIDYFSLIKDSYLEYLKQKEEINLEIKKQFEKANLEMAFPTQELILKKD